MNQKRFSREIERLRDPDRVARMEVPRVALVALEGLHEPQTALDIGTGSGLFAEQFSAHGLQVTGLDVNPAMLPVARQFVPAGIFQEGVAERLPFPDASFDLVFMGLVLHETDDMQAALSEACRVAIQRLAILEWPDEDQPVGPPRADRVAFKSLESLAMQVGFKSLQSTRLTTLVYYELNK